MDRKVVIRESWGCGPVREYTAEEYLEFLRKTEAMAGDRLSPEEREAIARMKEIVQKMQDGG